MAPFTIIARLSSGERVPVVLADEESAGSSASEEAPTVADLRARVAAALGAAPADLRLVLRGRILRIDDAPIDHYAVANNDVVHVARPSHSASSGSTHPHTQAAADAADVADAADAAAAAAAAAAPSQRKAAPSSNATPMPGISSAALAAGLAGPASPGGLAGPEIADMLNHPLMLALLDSPAFMRMVLESDPRLRSLEQQNPELWNRITSPEALREMSQAIRNPNRMQEMMRNHDRALSNIEATPGGFNYISSQFRQLEQQLGSSMSPDPSTDEANRRMAERLGATSPSRVDGGPNSQALPNPWDPQRNSASSSSVSSASSAADSNAGSRPSSAFSRGGALASLFGNTPGGGVGRGTASGTSAMGGAGAIPGFPLFGGMPGMQPSPTSSINRPQQQQQQQQPNLNMMLQQLGLLNELNRMSQQMSQTQLGQTSTTATTTTTPTSQPNPMQSLFGMPMMPPLHPLMYGMPSTTSSSVTSTGHGSGIGPTLASTTTTNNTTSAPIAIASTPSTDQQQQQQPLEDRFRDQLATLHDMGFIDDEKNRRALLASAGNTDAAVGYLLEM